MSDVVQVRQLHKAFGDHEVIKDVSFDVTEGSVTVILRPSGSGKTTLLRSLNALELPDTGTVSVGEVTVDFSQVRPDKRGRLPQEQRSLLRRLSAQSGFVFQAHHLFPHRTAIENVTEGPMVVQKLDAAVVQ